MSAQSDIGPSGPPAWRVVSLARELAALASLAGDCARQGPKQDLQRAVATLDRMRAILGNDPADGLGA
jgi:hypothetical protein